jgi:hypothetical protein
VVLDLVDDLRVRQGGQVPDLGEVEIEAITLRMIFPERVLGMPWRLAPAAWWLWTCASRSR